MTELNLETIAMWCRSYLFNYQHISRREETTRCIRELRKALTTDSEGEDRWPSDMPDSKHNDYTVWTLDTAPESASLVFEQHYGRQPEYVRTIGNRLYVGPIPRGFHTHGGYGTIGNWRQEWAE